MTDPREASRLTSFDEGVVVGILIGEGSFGGDGKQPQVTLRMHTRHEALFRWMVERFPRTRLYGPYGHGGRSYYQWMARGAALVEDVLPLLESRLGDHLDAYATQRLAGMLEAYAPFIARTRERSGASGSGARGVTDAVAPGVADPPALGVADPQVPERE